MKPRLRLVFKCCRCGHSYPLAEGFVSDPEEWNQGWSEKYLEVASVKNMAHFPIECPECGLRHLLIILPIPWEEP